VDRGVPRARVPVLLRRFLDDVDDEVRDRAAMYLAILDRKTMCEICIGDDSAVAWAALERSTSANIAGRAHSIPFDIKATPLITRDQEETERVRVKAAAQESVALTAGVTPVASGEDVADEISGVEALKKLGSRVGSRSWILWRTRRNM
jgi:coatomer protein complex subunit gamma